MNFTTHLDSDSGSGAAAAETIYPLSDTRAYEQLHERVMEAAAAALDPPELEGLLKTCSRCCTQRRMVPVAPSPSSSRARWSAVERQFLALVDNEIDKIRSALGDFSVTCPIYRKLMTHHGFPKRSDRAYRDAVQTLNRERKDPVSEGTCDQPASSVAAVPRDFSTLTVGGSAPLHVMIPIGQTPEESQRVWGAIEGLTAVCVDMLYPPEGQTEDELAALEERRRGLWGQLEMERERLRATSSGGAAAGAPPPASVPGSAEAPINVDGFSAQEIDAFIDGAASERDRV